MKFAAFDRFLPKTGVRKAVFMANFEFLEIKKFKKL
jgi:hypothetical protein